MWHPQASDHPLALGCIERACRQVQRKFLRSGDLIIGLGYDTIEVEYEAWIDDRPLLQIDIEPVDVAPSVNVLHQVTGDLDSSLARLACFHGGRCSRSFTLSVACPILSLPPAWIENDIAL